MILTVSYPNSKPGAGKTTLGIELIRRVGKPCLILSPRVVIRQQWLERIRSSFFTEKAQIQEKNETEKILSADIRYPGKITSITYQTLYCAMTEEKNVEESEDGEEKEEVDFAGFEFLKQVKKAGIGTVCLDECHHLKNEWWKALEKFMGLMENVTVIALTATPPYDSTPVQWERYIRMCGAVDAEITIPELVKEGSLCPHQDYVWFNCPSEEEEKQIVNFRQNAADMLEFLMADTSLRKAASTHPALTDYDGYYDRMLENPGYLSGLLVYCQAKEIPYARQWKEVLGVNEMPSVSEKWMEYFLQGFLFDDADSYSADKKYREALQNQLKEAGLSEKKRVRFLVNDRIEKMLVNSSGKLDSILNIASCEHTAMGEKLRMLILPDTAREAFTEEINEIDPDLPTPIFREFADNDGKGIGYAEVAVKGRLSIYTRAVTRIFERGYIQILIGTKSLLGEGWDSPGINSLILASTVGSFVLGNQMRGRAIRICPWDPDKVSNIWHLVCMSAPREEREKRRMGCEEPELSEDFRTLERRMDAVLGVSYDGTVIENGIQRLHTIKRPFSRQHIIQMNEDTARRSADRFLVSEHWKHALYRFEKTEVADEIRADRKRFRPGTVFVHALGVQIIITLAEILNVLCSLFFRTGENEVFALSVGVTAVFILLSIVLGGKLLCHGGRTTYAKEYFCVPDIFAGSREKAEMFRMELIPYIGRFRLVYTRNAEGRKILLHARAKAFSSKNDRRMDRKKRVKGMLE